MHFEQLAARVAATLRAHRVVARDGRYTRPAAKTYPHQWLWDSRFHALVRDLLGERDLARDALRALFRAQQADGPDRGRLPHMTLFGGTPEEAAQDADGPAALARDLALWGNPRAPWPSGPASSSSVSGCESTGARSPADGAALEPAGFGPELVGHRARPRPVARHAVGGRRSAALRVAVAAGSAWRNRFPAKPRTQRSCSA